MQREIRMLCDQSLGHISWDNSSVVGCTYQVQLRGDFVDWRLP